MGAEALERPDLTVNRVVGIVDTVTFAMGCDAPVSKLLDACWDQAQEVVRHKVREAPRIESASEDLDHGHEQNRDWTPLDDFACDGTPTGIACARPADCYQFGVRRLDGVEHLDSRNTEAEL